MRSPGTADATHGAGMSEQANRLTIDRVAPRETAGRHWFTLHNSLFARLVAAFLAVTLPALVLTTVGLSQRAAGTFSSYATVSSENTARAAVNSVELWLAERRSGIDPLRPRVPV